MSGDVVCIITCIAVIALIFSVGCEPEPAGEQGVGQPADLVDGTHDRELPEPADGEETEMAWTIRSNAFEDGELIPEEYTDDGADISPPLTFEDIPEGAVEIALICHDPDAPVEGGWTHWVVYGMDPEIGGLPAHVPDEPTLNDPALLQGKNTWGKIGYGGPAPPEGKPHRYQFRGYALSESLDLAPGASKDQLEAAMDDRIVGEAVLEGLYGRG